MIFSSVCSKKATSMITLKGKALIWITYHHLSNHSYDGYFVWLMLVIVVS